MALLKLNLNQGRRPWHAPRGGQSALSQPLHYCARLLLTWRMRQLHGWSRVEAQVLTSIADNRKICFPLDSGRHGGEGVLNGGGLPGRDGVTPEAVEF
jgi:hypothetical protein